VRGNTIWSHSIIGRTFDVGSTPERARRDNFVGVVFSRETRSELPVSDLEQRLRKSEQKKSQLQRRIKELIGEDSMRTTPGWGVRSCTPGANTLPIACIGADGGLQRAKSACCMVTQKITEPRGNSLYVAKILRIDHADLTAP